MSFNVSGSMSLENTGDSSRESGIVEEVLKDGEIEELNRSEEDVEGDECPADRKLAAGVDFAFSHEGNGNLRNLEMDRKGVKKQCEYDLVTSQRRRRSETLRWQRQRRDEMLEKIRQLEDSAYSDSETEDETDFTASVRKTSNVAHGTLEEIHEESSANDTLEEMDITASKRTPQAVQTKKHHKNRRKRYKQAPCSPMLSEWLLEKPEDFEDKWLAVLCPVGKRCIVMTSRGKTKVFSRSDEYLGSYRSLLPGGCRYNYGDSTSNRNRGVTILDCIWSPQSETFYVLDIICWNSHSCVNCDTECRQYFLHSKFMENLKLLESSSTNPFPFRPLLFFSACEMSEKMSKPIPFPEDVDGILLFHKEAFYISGTNPLCLWILLTQVESLLSISVIPEVLSRQREPKNLKSRKKQMKKYGINEQPEMDTDPNQN